MKRSVEIIVLILALVGFGAAQNLTTVTASKIQRGGVLIPSGKICFLGTDSNDNPVGFRVGGGGQEVMSPYCSAISNGAIVGAFNVANPANTAPANINYRVTVTASNAGVLLTYSGVQFSGATFNFDSYVPSANLPLGASVNTLSVGSLTVTSGCTGCGVGGGGSGYATIENAASAITQRSVLNWTADITCADNSGQARSDCALAALGTPGTYTKVTTDAKGRVSAGTSAHTTDLADFNPAAPASSGKVPIWDQTSQTYIPGDPLVQGIVGDGSTTAANPVAIGGYDTQGTPVLHKAIELNGAPTGSEYGLVTRPIPSGTQNVSVTNASIPVTGTFWQATQPVSGTVTANQGTAAALSGKWPVQVTDGTNTMPTGDSSSRSIHETVDNSSIAVTQSSGANLHVNCDSGCGGSPGFTDNSTFTAGTTVESNVGGVYNDSLSAVTSGNGAAARITPNRGLHVNLRNNSGTEIGTSSNPVRVDPTGTTTQPVSGTVTATQTTGTNLHMVCDSGCSSSAGFADNSAFTVGTTAINPLGGYYTTGADPSITSGNAGRARIDSHSYLLVDGSQVTQPVSGTVTANQGGTWTVQPGNTANTTPWLATINQGGNSATVTASNALKVDGSAVTQPVSGTVTANAGTGTFNIQSNASVNLAQYGGAAVGVSNPQFVTITPGTTGGWSKAHFLAQTTTVQTVKSSQGTFGGYFIFNPNTTDVCVQVFDNSGTITLGTTVPDMVFHLPGVSSGGTGVAANLEIANGVQMANAIKLAVATTCTGNTAPGSGLDITVFYK